MKKYLPAALDNILTLHESAVLFAMGKTDWSHSVRRIFPKLMLTCATTLLQRFYYFYTQTPVNIKFWGITNMKC